LCSSAYCVVHDLGALQGAQGTESGCIWIANNVPVLRVNHISSGRTLLRVPPSSQISAGNHDGRKNKEATHMMENIQAEKKLLLAQPLPESEFKFRRSRRGLGAFGKPTGELGIVEQLNEDDALVEWDDGGHMRLLKKQQFHRFPIL
jgi:hypothetical protein